MLVRTGGASRVALAIWALALLGACASLSGLDSLQESDCIPDCDGGDEQAADDAWSGAEGDTGGLAVDTGSGATAESGVMDAGVDAAREAGRDGSVEGGGDAPTTDGAEDSSGIDEGAADAADAWAADAAGDGAADATLDAADAGDATVDAGAADAEGGAGADASDATADVGCGPPDTVTNCGACGQACASNASVKTASCNVRDTGPTTCTYACSTGHLDCNASVAPNTDGCECPTSGGVQCCPSNACPTQHTTGLTGGAASTFYDCTALGTYSQKFATEACTAFTGNASACNSMYGCGTAAALCSTSCNCWGYAGSAAGFARKGGTCGCPGSGDTPYQ
jgi:hypothetical protein